MSDGMAALVILWAFASGFVAGVAFASDVWKWIRRD
jgi:hypothetical protein